MVLEGACLAQRWETEGRVNLYYLPDKARGFFVEVGIEDEADSLVEAKQYH